MSINEKIKTMKILKTLFAIAILSISCSKDNDEPQPQPEIPKKVVDVYLAGQEYTGTNYIGKYWKNGTPTILNSNTTYSTQVTDMAVSGTDVYVSGDEYSGVSKLYYWKNGIPTLLPITGTFGGATTGIAVSGNDVYVSGHQFTTGNDQKAVYWKNGNQISLTTSPGYSFTNDIALSGQNVCVIGGTQTANNFFISKLWIDGVPRTISNLDSRVSSIFVAGTNIYISGKEKSNLDVFAAKYWILNTLTDVFTKIDLGTFGLSSAESIFVSGTDVYVAGFERNATGTDFAKYWKNGQAIVLSDGTKDAYCASIMVDGTDVYTCGADGNIMKHWKNNVATNYTDGTKPAGGITVFAITR